MTPAEMLLAAQAGVMRQVQNIRDGRKHAHGANDASGWQMHIEGAMGEAALAKFLGAYWGGKGQLRAPDVGDVDVRTAAGPNHCLILHESDPDERRFYLLTGGNGRYQVRGSILGRDGKRPEHWKDPVGGRAAYFVPQSALEPPA